MKKTSLILIFLSFFFFLNLSWGDEIDLKEIKNLAESGYVDAQLTLGSMYLSGKGLPQNYTEAMKWYRKAADQGEPWAQFVLGGMYYRGLGVSKNYTEGIKWIRKAAEQGNARAQCDLGVIYYRGLGVSKNYTEAMKWFRRAAEQGNARAQNYLGILKNMQSTSLNDTASGTKNQEIIFKVQIISSNTHIATNSPQFKGLKNVWEYRDSGLYKYTVGNEKDLKSASILQSELRRKGFVGAFVVAFKNGKRIPVREAKKLLN